MGALPMDNLYRLHRTRFRDLLATGLDVRESMALVDITYSSCGGYVTAHFANGTSDTGALVVGADGPKSTTRRLLLGDEKAKNTVLDFTSTMCFTRFTKEQAMFLRSPPYHPLFQVIVHPGNMFGVLGLHDAPDPEQPDEWTFFLYISFPEPAEVCSSRTSRREHARHQKELATTFADPIKSAFEWMDEGNENVWYGKMNHWDPREEGHRWDNHGGRVTLAGDAAHPMTFQRGQGLNHAIADAARRCEGIVRMARRVRSWERGKRRWRSRSMRLRWLKGEARKWR